MLKTTKHLLALALSAAMLLGSPGMLTAFADNGDDLAMAKSLSVQTIGDSGNNASKNTIAPESNNSAAVVEQINSLPTTDNLANYTPTIELNPEDEGYQEAYQAALDAYYSQIQEQVKAARASYDALTEEQKVVFDATVLAKLESLENLFAMREQINMLPEGESDYTVTQDGNTFTTSEGIKIIYQFTDYLTGKDLTNDPAFADTKAFVDEGFLQFPELNGRALNNDREPDGPKFTIPAAYDYNKENKKFFNFTYENDSGETIHRILRDVHYQFEGGGNGSSNTTTGIMPNPPMAPFLFDSTNGATLTVNYVFRNEGDPNLQNDILTNEIQNLNPSIIINGQEMPREENDDNITFYVNSKEDIFLTYSPTMDMKKLGFDGSAEGEGWNYLLYFYGNISDDSIIYLHFTFDENIDLENSIIEPKLESDMFSYDSYFIEGQDLTIVCHWDSQKADENWPDPQTLITLSGLQLKIRDDWEGDSLTIQNYGWVDGFAIASNNYAWRIDGGEKYDTLVLKLKSTDPAPDPTPDPEPQPEPDPEPDRPSRPSRDDDDDWEPLPDAPVKEKAETVEVETEVPEQTETQTPVQQPEKHNPETGDASFAPVSLALAAASLSAAALLARKRK